MNVEIELKKLLTNNDHKPKTKKDGSIWTKGGSVWTLWRGYRGSEVNYHNNGTVAFNYLSNYMRDMLKKHHTDATGLNRDEQMKLFHEVLSSLPFYMKIKNFIPTPKWSIEKGIEYFSISSRVGIDVLKEVVEFILSDSGNSSRQVYEASVTHNQTNYVPEKKDSDEAIDLLNKDGKKRTVAAILGQIEKKCLAEGKKLKSNWRIITEKNIRENWYK